MDRIFRKLCRSEQVGERCRQAWYRKGADSIPAGVNIKHFVLLALWGQWLMEQNVVVGSFPRNGTYAYIIKLRNRNVTPALKCMAN